jgi:phospholipid/cholesterol/gamma-HCH transport system substrate-binding protein
MKLPFRRRGGRKKGISTLRAGTIGAVILIVFTYLGFTKFALPFKSQYTADIVFQNANQLRPGALVRVAGINVGKVTTIQPVPGCKSTTSTPTQCQAADVAVQIQKVGLPLRKDATFWIRPRIFLEGNFFIDIQPGSPSAPPAPSGYVFPMQQTRTPVQFDQILTSLQQNTRENLQTLLQQYGQAVKQGGPAYNRSIQYWLPAYQYSSLVEHDMLGLGQHDLSNAIYTQGDVSQALNANPQALQSFVHDFNTTARALATQRIALENAVNQLPRTLSAAIPAFHALNSDFCSGPQVPNCAPGPLPKLAKALLPGTKSTIPMVNASLPFLSQLRALVQPSELQGLANDLSVTVPALARLTIATIPFMRNGVRPFSSCSANVIYPWSQLTLNDSHFNASNGFPPRKVYIEAVDFLPGLAGESRNFDANGPYIRILGAYGNAGITSLQSGLVGGTLAPLVGFEPQPPPGGTIPPLQPNAPCENQPPISDLSSNATPAPQPLSPSTLPSAVGLVPLPNLPLGLSKDGKQSNAGKSSKQARPVLSAPQILKALQKQPLFSISDTPPATSTATKQAQAKPATAVRTSAKPRKAASTG